MMTSNISAPSVSMETIDAVAAKLRLLGAGTDVLTRANELRQLAGQNATVACGTVANVEEVRGGDETADWTWSWPF